MLLQLLQEASTLKLDDVKKAIRKDAKTASILAKEAPKLEEISDKEGFLSTLKFLLLNNTNVQAFVASRDNVKELSKAVFTDLRKLRASELKQSDIDDLHEFVKLLFKEHGSVERMSMSPDLRRTLSDWINKSGRYYNLPLWAMNELKALPNVRPSKKVVLYRGLLFKDYDLSERKSYDGTLEIGNGIAFLKSVRKGKRTVDLEWDRPSSWTTSKTIADQFARNGPASSSFSATLQWLERGTKAIDGALGFVIAIHADPEDVLIDMTKINVRSQYANESEMILKPGKYLARVVKKYTPEGPVDLDAEESVKAESISGLYSDITGLAASIESPSLTSIDYTYWYAYTKEILPDLNMFKAHARDSTTTQIQHDVATLLSVYKKMAALDAKTLAAEHFVDDDVARKQASTLRTILKSAVSRNRTLKKEQHEMTADEFRKTYSSFAATALEQLLIAGRALDSSTARNAQEVMQPFGKHVKVEFPATFGKMGLARQKTIATEILVKVADELGVKKEDDADTIKLMINLVRRVDRNTQLLRVLVDFKNMVKDTTNEDS